MNTAARTREAALLVHGLPPDAREQVLGRLSAGARAQIEPLLAELTSLGIPSTPHDLPDPTPFATPDPDHRGQVAALEPSQVLSGLRRFDAAATRALLRVADWPWKEDVLAATPESLGLRSAAEADDLACGSRWAPRAAELLCKRLLDGVSMPQDAAHPVKQKAGRRRWFTWKR